ncbi:hypothetical protein [Paenibacillus vini]|uniref:Oxidoreductase n=1 Tax=Paenibacillus vini TaxID=1476024 RepID=A0ABQ4M871_9BACL|nr:hypothetical protein [Paenibacillus vini]GIP52179.1 hypothetical protein J42TS3_12140 [Paenibacillus vini]
MKKRFGLWAWTSCILLVCLLASLYYNFKGLPYKKAQDQSYSAMINQSFGNGLKNALTETDLVIESLRDRASDASVMQRLGILSANLKTVETAFISMDPAFAAQGSSTYLMYNVMTDYYNFVQQDVAEEINNHTLDKDEGRNKIMRAMEMMREDLTELHRQFPEDEVIMWRPARMEAEWRETVRNIVLRKDQLDLYERLKIKYGFDANDNAS